MIKEFSLRYQNFVTKAVTFSYDDGTFYDVFLADVLNKYGLKGTFNINSGLFGYNYNLDFGDGKILYHNRLSAEQIKTVCAGHEIAAHSLTHPLLINQPKEFLDEQVLTDMQNIDALTGEKTVGFVYPGGPHDEATDAYLQDKVLYARTAENSHSFDLPASFVPFNPTVCHLEPQFLPLCKQYAESSPAQINWLYIWGHSYEFAWDGVYDNFVAACKLLSGHKDIWFTTNRDIIDYVTCARALQVRGDAFVNNTHRDVYLVHDGQQITVLANGRFSVK